MPKLDTKTVRLSDGTELQVCWTWAAAERLRKATGLDLIADSDLKGSALMQQLPAIVQCILATKEDREKFSSEEFAESVAFKDLDRIAEEIFSGMKPDKPEGQQNIPFVNGKAEPDSPSNLPTQ